MNIVLVGQPNCGKSTIFNHIVGYKSYTANFSGASVNYTHGEVVLGGKKANLIDLPGLYSLSGTDKAEEVSKEFLLTRDIDLIINVIDASVLARSLELTLELIELGLPMIVDLNMVDEAARKGMMIDSSRLSSILKVPVFETIGSKGTGILSLFEAAILAPVPPAPMVRFDADIEAIIDSISHKLDGLEAPYSSRLISIKILEEDPFFTDLIRTLPEDIQEEIRQLKDKIETQHGLSSAELINQGRHAKALSIFEKVISFTRSKPDWRDKADNILLHNFWGYVILFAILFSMFYIIFHIGKILEELLLTNYDALRASMESALSPDSFLFYLFDGILQGLGGGIAIVLPYLVPFLLLLSLLEDVGYLPRVAYLLDALMHRIGLHGTSIIPTILGYGCNVPAVMATRILDSPRDRFIAAAISAMVPCSARMTVIFGLAAFYLGPTAAFFIYLLNILIIGLMGHIMSRLMPEVSPGMVMEIPPYHVPSLKNLLAKIWMRLQEFIVIAWPILIVGSIVLNIITFTGFDQVINTMLRPITYLLDLPAETGNTLIFGVLRKELSLIMLLQALNTTDVSTVLSYTQILTFTMFVTFYIPCVATIGVLVREIGGKRTLLIVWITLLLALLIGWLTKVLYPLLLS